MELDDETLAFAHRMFELAREGKTAELAEMVDAGLSTDLTNDKGDTLLILAAYYSHPETVSALVERGAALDRANDRGQTALAAAAFRGDTKTAQVLLTAGADPLAGGPNAVETARFFGNSDVLAMFNL
ncbi:MAG: Ankyrin [Frankiales bacterium]|nr:Ankyrin [Frankiales bacterium]